MAATGINRHLEKNSLSIFNVVMC